MIHAPPEPLDEPIPGAHPLDWPGGESLLFAGEPFGPVRVPKDPAANLRWRRTLLERGRSEPSMRATLHALCSHPSADGIIFALNAFGWTYRQRIVLPDGRTVEAPPHAAHCPLITWPVQDAAIRFAEDRITRGTDFVVDKSRQMGATVLLTDVFAVRAAFRHDQHFHVLSMTEDLVDRENDPFSVFWKVRYFLKGLPTWLVPEPESVRLKINFPHTGSSIIGRSTTGRQGRGGALTAVMIDEMALIAESESMWVGYSQSTSCRIGNSTPFGPTFYSDLVQGGGVDVLDLPWWDHPEKGRGRTLVRDPETREVYVTSPFYERECERHGGRRTKAIAQELDRRHDEAGATFFDAWHLLRQRALAREPGQRLSIGWAGRATEDEGVRAICDGDRDIATLHDIETASGGPWRLWTPLHRTRGGIVRPPQNRTYTVGVDVSHGQGASNSVVSVFCVEIGAKVAELATANLNPHQLARQVAIAALWFGGGGDGLPIVAVEVNGPGATTLRQLSELGYPALWTREGRGAAGDRPARKFGWWSSPATKQLLLQEYRDALNTDRFRNPSAEALDEARKYVRYARGGIGPGRLEHESESARATHGDRVIADALAWYAARSASHVDPVEPEPEPDTPAELERVAEEMDTEGRSISARNWRRRRPWERNTT